MQEREPQASKPTDIVIAEFGDDVPDGTTNLEDFAAQAYGKAFSKDYREDLTRLKKLRDQAEHGLDCPCRQCKNVNLRQRRAITNKWKMPNDSQC